MKEEDYLLKNVGKGNPFRTPEGYFDNLTSEIMNKLPEKDYSELDRPVSLWEKVKPLLYLAAFFVGAALILRMGTIRLSDDPVRLAAEEEESERQYIENVYEDAMLDDYSFYELLTDAE